MTKFSLAPTFELSLFEEGRYTKIVGIDEVGRGCLAGPVGVGAYTFDIKSEIFDGVKDSKLVTEKNRNQLHSNLADNNPSYLVKYAEPTHIDEHGIAKAIEVLIWKIIKELQDEKTYFLIDGRFRSDFGEHTEKIVDGDANYYTIAAASILAKVERDRLMERYALEYPKYGFEKHKGYGTKAHLDALREHGPVEIHRKSFKPVGDLVIE